MVRLHYKHLFSFFFQSKLKVSNLFFHRYWHIGYEDDCDSIVSLYNLVVHLVSLTVILPDLNDTSGYIKSQPDSFSHVPGIVWLKSRYFKFYVWHCFRNLKNTSFVVINRFARKNGHKITYCYSQKIKNVL